MNYFVTGATGFVGRHLVEQLLRREGTVYALVREGSRGRLDALAERLGASGDRIVAVPGDLTAPRLGVADDGPLGADVPIDHLFHLAAIYDVEADERTAWATNVEGTRNAIDFANSREVGRFHHVSSVAVAGDHRGTFGEEMLDAGQRLPHVYHRTKYESEAMVRDGVRAPTLIYRPGLVVGHSDTGEIDKVDGPYYAFGTLKRMRGALPRWLPLAGPDGGRTTIVPVDYVARAIDHIAHLPDDELPGDTFHLVDPEPMTLGEAVNAFAKAAGAPQLAFRLDEGVTGVVPESLRAGALALPGVRQARDRLYGELGIPPAAMEVRDFKCRFDARNAERALAGSGIAVPPLSSYADRLWDYWERNLDPDLFRGRSLAAALHGRRVLITGASSGIGLETALRAGEAGATVLLVARTREKLEQVAERIRAGGGRAHVHPADLSDLDDIDRLAREVLDHHGGVDVLVNNAGRSIRRSVARSYDRFHDFERTIRLNYFGALKLILAFLPGMRERKGGHIVNVSSLGVQTNTPRFSAYIASKSALDAFSRCAAPECLSDDVDFTTVYMPLVRTPMIAPTDIYKAFPALSPQQAAEMLCEAMIDRPKRKGSRLGTLGEVLYALSPSTVDRILSLAYELFPDSPAAKRDDAGKEGASDRAEAALQLANGQPPEEMSGEAVAMAYLLRGVHF